MAPELAIEGGATPLHRANLCLEHDLANALDAVEDRMLNIDGNCTL